MKEWICLGCRTVFESSKPSLHCDGKGLVPFSPSQHGHLLIGMSNWVKIAGKDYHPTI